MGNVFSNRQQTRNDIEANESLQAYKYPPKSGSYFGSHFLMGGERFEVSPPEAYLFGENSDLNFLSQKPVPFPYSQTASTEPTRSLHCLVNIRRDSLKFVKLRSSTYEVESANEDSQIEPPTPLSIADLTEMEPTENAQNVAGNEQVPLEEMPIPCRYNIEFTFDCDTPCNITIYYFATESITANGLQYTPSSPDFISDTFNYDVCANQTFSQKSHVFEPNLYRDDDLKYDPAKGAVPIVIHCVAKQNDPNDVPQSHATFAVVDKSAEGHGYVLKPLKQKIFIDGVLYLLQEIYGIENKNANKDGDDEDGRPVDDDENGADCVVCMSELRDTIILPCRHLCLCNACAETLRYKANNCPICRSPFRALLQIKTLRRLKSTVSAPSLHLLAEQGHSSTADQSNQGPPSPGGFLTTRYETVPLIEALNGPVDHTQTCVTALPAPSSSGANTLASSRSEPELAFRTRSPPNIPPRTGKSKKKDRRSIAPIQEVLTVPSVRSSAPERLEEGEEVDFVADIDATYEPVTVVVTSSGGPVREMTSSTIRCGPFVTGLENPKDSSDSEDVDSHEMSLRSKPGITRIAIGSNSKDQSSSSSEAELGVLPGVVVRCESAGALQVDEFGTPKSSYSAASLASSTKPLLPDEFIAESQC